MIATKADVQALIDACPDGGTVVLPPVVHIDASTGPVTIDRSMTVQGAPTTITATPPTERDRAIIDITAPNGSVIRVCDITGVGPTDPAEVVNDLAFLQWSLYKTQDSTFVCERVTTTGLFSCGINRAGGGLFVVSDCHLEFFEEGLSCYASHGEEGRLVIDRCSFYGGPNKKPSSIGAYVHPNIHTTVTRSTFTDLGRYGVYWNGTPKGGQATQVIADCTFTDCDIMQTASECEPLVLRCTVSGHVAGPGTTVRCSATFVDCDMSGTHPIVCAAFSPGALVRFDRCTFSPDGYAVTFAGDSSSRYVLRGCRFALADKGAGGNLGAGRTFTTTRNAACVIDLGDLLVCQDAPTDPQRRWWAQVQGPVAVLWDHTTVSTPVPRDAWIHGETTVGAVFVGDPVVGSA